MTARPPSPSTAAPPGSRVLLFDLGGVLVDFRGFEELAGLLAEPPAGDLLRERWLASPSVRAFECGRIEADEFARRFVDEWQLRLAPAEFLRRFGGWARGLYPGATELLAGLAGRYRLACLSNANALHAPLYRAPLAARFEALFFSFELGLLKPDPEIFRAVVDRLAVPAARITLFDDVETNVRAARAAGLRAEQVRGVAELAARIAALEGAGRLDD